MLEDVQEFLYEGDSTQKVLPFKLNISNPIFTELMHKKKKKNLHQFT